MEFPTVSPNVLYHSKSKGSAGVSRISTTSTEVAVGTDQKTISPISHNDQGAQQNYYSIYTYFNFCSLYILPYLPLHTDRFYMFNLKNAQPLYD